MSKALIKPHPPKSYFSDFDENFHKEFLRSAIGYEKKNHAAQVEGISFLYNVIGVVHYKTPETMGSVEIWMASITDSGPASMVKCKDGSIAICFSPDTFHEYNTDQIENLCAHELGHLLCGHMDDTEPMLPNLYEQENRRYLESGEGCFKTYERKENGD